MGQYKQLTYEQRCQIEVLKKRGMSQSEIAGAVGVSQSTISRELARNTGQRGYRHLRRSGKRYERRRNGKPSRGQIKNRVSIDERPAVVERKSRVDDWEIDTVIGKGHSGVLVTIVERATLFTLVAPVADKSAEAVTQATIELLLPYKDLVHTITADNGKEFAYHKRIATALDAKVYFAHPYHSWERGLNENTNGLLRQYWPKQSELKSVTFDEVAAVVSQLNARPRKTLRFSTPEKLMPKRMAAKAA